VTVYRDLIEVPFIALANEDEIRVSYLKNQEREEIHFLPEYRQLTQVARLKSVISTHHLL